MQYANKGLILKQFMSNVRLLEIKIKIKKTKVILK